MNFMDEDMGMPRSIEELIKGWPEQWEKFEQTIKFLNSDVGKNATEGGALRSLHDAPVQEMLKYLLELSKSDIQDEHFDQVMLIALAIINDERIKTDNGELIAIVAFSLELFTRLFELFPTKCQEHMQTVVNKVKVLLLELAAVPTFGKKLSDVSAMKRFVAGNGDAQVDDEDDDEPEDDLTDDDSRLFVWSQCSRVIMMVLENNDHRKLVAGIANAVIPPVIKILKSSDYGQLKMEASDLLEQICILSFKAPQIITWEDIGNEPNVLEEFMNEENGDEDDPTSMIGLVQKNGEYHDSFPYVSIDLSAEDLQDLLHYLINLNIEGGVDMAEVQTGPLVGVLSCVAGKFEPEITTKVIFTCLDLIKKNIAESQDVIAKLTQFVILKEIFGLAPAQAIQARFVEFLGFIEAIMANEAKKLKASAQPGGGKKNRGGRGGGGGRGRGRGGGGGGPPKPDPEKELQFKVVQRQLAVVLERLFRQSGEHIFAVAEKFFTSTSSAFKSHDLHFTFLCSLGVELAKEESAARPDFEANKKLLLSKLEIGYKSMSDNLGSKFVSGKSKLEGCKCLSKISSCTHNGVPVFPEYLSRTLACLTDVIVKDGYKVGPTAIIYLEKVILANKKSEVLTEKLPEIVESVAMKFLHISEDKKDDQMLEFMQLVSCELLEVVYYQKEFQTLLKPLIPTLAPSLKGIIKENGDVIKSFEEGVEGEEDDEEDGPEKLTFDLSSLAIKDKEEKSDEVKETTTTTTTQEPAASTENATPSEFAFNFDSSSAPTTATPNAAFPKFDFGSPTPQAVPKFDFGASSPSGTPFTAPSFNFGAPTGGSGEVAKSEKSGSAGRGRGRGHTGPGTIDNALTMASTGRGRGGPGGRGRGRAGQRGHCDDDDCDDDDCDECSDDDEDDDDEEDEDDMFGGDEEEDPMAREASACLSALAVVTEMYKCGSDNVLFAELLAQSLETANYLKTVPEYSADTFEFLRAVADEKK
jgi:uncharacterized membrane protein YgcG